VLVNLKKEENSDTCYGMDGPWAHDDKRNRGQMLEDLTYMWHLIVIHREKAW
jgi:hypothetical protein